MSRLIASSPGRITIALAGVLAVLAALVGAPAAEEPVANVEPRFFDWGVGSEVGDRFVIRVESVAAEDGRALLVEDGLVVANGAVESDGVSRGIDDLTAALEEPVTLASDDAALAAVVALDGVESVRSLGFDLYAVAGSVTADDLAAIEGVASVERDVAVATASTDELYPLQWPIENSGDLPGLTATADADVDGLEGWHRARGSGVVVAVIDSGVDVTHPDLTGNVWMNADELCGNGVDDDANGYVDDCSGWDFASGTPDVSDRSGHGTHVAGIIAATADNKIGVAGLAYDAEVMPLKIGDDTPLLSAAIEAFAYAIDNGARVINASWVTNDPAAEPLLSAALDAARDAGVLVVAGAGNDGVNIDEQPYYPASLEHSNLITVGASTPIDTPADYSNVGTRSVDLFAPGSFIVSTLPGGSYGAFSGTSMAAPHVAAAAALLWSAAPDATIEEVRSSILDTADLIRAFRGTSNRRARLNVGAAAAVDRFAPPVEFTFRSFDSFEPGVDHAVTVTARAFERSLVQNKIRPRFRATLLVPGPSGPLAVAGHRFVVDGEVVETDATGRAYLGDEFKWSAAKHLGQTSGISLDFTTALPTGSYVLVMELIDGGRRATDPAMGDPSAVFFTVGLDGAVSVQPVPSVGFDEDTAAPIEPPTSPETDRPSVTTAPPAETTPTTVASTTTTTTTVPEAGTTTPVDPSVPTDPSAPVTTVPAAGESDLSSAPPSQTDRSVGTGESAPGSSTTTLPSEPGEAADPDESVESIGEPSGPTTPVSGEPEADDLSIVRVNPSSGPVAGGTTVTIVGRLPNHVRVAFGEADADIVTTGAGYVVVVTRRHTPGVVDVVVTDVVSGDQVVLPSGFFYYETSTTAGESPSTEPDLTTGDEPVDPSVGSGDDPVPTETDSGAASTPEAPTVSDPAAPSETTDGGDAATSGSEPSVPDQPASEEVPVPSDQTMDDWVDSLLVTPEGLDLQPLPAGDPFAGLSMTSLLASRCLVPSCTGWVLGTASTSNVTDRDRRPWMRDDDHWDREHDDDGDDGGER